MADSRAYSQVNNSTSRQSDVFDIANFFAETQTDNESVNIREEMVILKDGTTVDISEQYGENINSSVATNLYNSNLGSNATIKKEIIDSNDEFISDVTETSDGFNSNVNSSLKKRKMFIKKEIIDTNDEFISDITETSDGFNSNVNSSLKKRKMFIKKESIDPNDGFINDKTAPTDGFSRLVNGTLEKSKVPVKREISHANNSLIHDKAKATHVSNSCDFFVDEVKKEMNKNDENIGIISGTDDSSDEEMNVSEEDVHSSDIEQMFNTKKIKKSKNENKEPLECSTCGKTFKLEHNLQKHVLSHSNGDLQPVRKFECKICGKKFKKKHHLRRHDLSHTEAKEFVCAHCEKSYKDKYDLKKHLASNHTVKECSDCGMTFPNDLELRKHRVIHKNLENKTNSCVSCHICQKTFLNNKYLKRHLQMHAKITPFLCTLCSKSFSSNFMLQEHMRTHTGERPFQCDKCDRKFSTKSNLVRHSRTHSKTKACNNCFAEFEDEEQFKAHKASCILNYECGRCGWICDRLSNLRRHMKTHTKYSDAEHTDDSEDIIVRIV